MLRIFLSNACEGIAYFSLLGAGMCGVVALLSLFVGSAGETGELFLAALGFLLVSCLFNTIGDADVLSHFDPSWRDDQ